MPRSDSGPRKRGRSTGKRFVRSKGPGKEGSPENSARSASRKSFKGKPKEGNVSPAKSGEYKSKGKYSKAGLKVSKQGRIDRKRTTKPFSEKTYSRTRTEEAVSTPSKIRLNKFIANSGVCSRREADQLIQMGLISVNGKVITELGYKVNLDDVVRHENKVLRAEKPVYILLNKPKGYLTTTDDPQQRNTVMELIGRTVKERVYPVGRLDRNTTGLLLLTNDGDLAEKLSHPSYNAKKIYKVDLDRPLSKADFQQILDGVKLEEGRAMVDDLAIISDDGKTVGIELHIGWNRVIRRIFEALNYQVIKLDRSVYAGLDKKELPRGKWRFLREEEIIRLKHFKK